MSVYCTACVALRVRCTSFFGGWAYMFVEGASACPSAASIFVYSRNQQPNRSTHMFFISIFFFFVFFLSIHSYFAGRFCLLIKIADQQATLAESQRRDGGQIGCRIDSLE